MATFKGKCIGKYSHPMEHLSAYLILFNPWPVSLFHLFSQSVRTNYDMTWCRISMDWQILDVKFLITLYLPPHPATGLVANEGFQEFPCHNPGGDWNPGVRGKHMPCPLNLRWSQDWNPCGSGGGCTPNSTTPLATGYNPKCLDLGMHSEHFLLPKGRMFPISMFAKSQIIGSFPTALALPFQGQQQPSIVRDIRWSWVELRELIWVRESRKSDVIIGI